jgi:hypothetical protein
MLHRHNARSRNTAGSLSSAAGDGADGWSCHAIGIRRHTTTINDGDIDRTRLFHSFLPDLLGPTSQPYISCPSSPFPSFLHSLHFMGYCPIGGGKKNPIYSAQPRESFVSSCLLYRLNTALQRVPGRRWPYIEDKQAESIRITTHHHLLVTPLLLTRENVR